MIALPGGGKEGGTGGRRMPSGTSQVACTVLPIESSRKG